MQRRLFAAALSLALAASTTIAYAQTITDSGGTVLPSVYDKSDATKVVQFCQITVTATATSLSLLLSAAGCNAVPSWAMGAYLTPEASATIAVRWRADGAAPTASVGQPVYAYEHGLVLGLGSLDALSLISATGASVTVDVMIEG